MNPTRGIPKYLLAIFAGILTIIAVGIWRSVKAPSEIGRVLGATDTVIAPKPQSSPPVPNSSLPSPNINAKYAVLIDEGSKNVMFAKGHQDQVPIASLTKVMTAILTVESQKLDEVVTITPEDLNVVGSHIGFVPGEKITVSELLKALLIKSSNEAGLALSRAISGDANTFVATMNQKALDLGLVQTHYGDPHGLSPDSKSSAFDQAILFSYALKCPEFKAIVNTPQVTIHSIDGKYAHNLENSNRLVTDEIHFDGILGGKTGYTTEAGHSLVSAAARNGHTTIAVILNTASTAVTASAQESYKLLDWGFANFTWPQ